MALPSIRVGLACACLVIIACGSVRQDADAPPSNCPQPLVACGDACTNLDSDNLHCGDCDTTCTPGHVCTGGDCVVTCQTDLVACGESCIDPLTDHDHCGASGDCAGANAGQACGGAQICDGTGQCASTCDAGLVDCAGTCVDPATDEAHCGVSTACTGGSACEAGQTCEAGVCVQPAQVKYVFVTSGTHDGAFGGLAGADSFCQQHAQAAGLSGTYLAWLASPGSSTSPATRMTHSSLPYVRTDGGLIAQGWTDLVDGGLLLPVLYTELGTPAPLTSAACGGRLVWSNVQFDGTAFDPFPGFDYSCHDWTSNSASAQANWGDANETSSFWTSWCNGGMCTDTFPLYCVQQ